LLVFPPAPGLEIRARWEIFRARNPPFLPSPDGADLLSRHADRILMAHCISGADWQCWQAEVKSEAAYALAFRQADARAPATPDRTAESVFETPPASIAATTSDAISAFSTGQAPSAAAPASVPADGIRQEHVESAASRVPRLLRLRGWPLALGSGLLLVLVVVNVLASLATAPGPFNVKNAAAEDMLSTAAAGNGLTLVRDSTKLSNGLAFLEKNGASCAQHQRLWRPGDNALRLEVALTVCSRPGTLEGLQSAAADGAHSAHTAVSDRSGIPYALDTDIATRLAGTAERVRTIIFRAGPVLAGVMLYYPGNAAGPTAAQVKLLNGTARAELAELPYQAGPDTTPSLAPSLAARSAARWRTGSLRQFSASS
jgi:hypothetical protein